MNMTKTTADALILTHLLRLGFPDRLAHELLKDQEVRASALGDLGLEPEGSGA